MNHPVRILQAAALISAAFILIFIFQIRADFPYVTPFYARLIGIPVVVFLTIIIFWIGSWQSAKSKIYAGLILILLVELFPLVMYIGNNEYPSVYYIDPQGEIVLSSFPGNVFQGESKGYVNDDVIAAYDWQHGKTKDSAGRPLLFYWQKPDGTISVYEWPVDHGEVLHRLDRTTFQKYELQQLDRAKSFIKEGDLVKAKDILKSILDQDPNDDDAYCLNRQIKQREEDAKAEAERQAAEQAEAERKAKEEKEKAEAAAASITDETEETAKNYQPQERKEEVAANHVRRYHPRRSYYSAYYSEPEPYYYSTPRTYSQQPSSSYYQTTPQYYQPQQSAPRTQYRESPVTVVPTQTQPSYYPTQPSTPTVIQVQPERKKGMSWKKKLGIIGAIAGGVAIEEIIRRH